MIARRTVLISTEGRAVLEGDKKARMLLVRAGCEIPKAMAAQFEGAEDLATREELPNVINQTPEEQKEKPAKK